MSIACEPRLTCHRAARMPSRGGSGFTLTELVAVVGIVAILAALAAPSFSDLIANKRAQAIASELYLALLKARSEAVTRNANVTLSSKAGSWENGWQILDPANAANLLDDRGAASGATITSSVTGVTYQGTGRVQGVMPSFLITTTAGSTSKQQCVSVDLSGRPYMKEGSTC